MKPSRILIVEDEAIISTVLSMHLERMGYAVAGTAATGEDAVRLAAETKPDLVLMDIRLAGPMDGVEAAERIRARDDVPVIFLTAYTDDATLQRAKLTTPFGYITKPFNERELYASVEIALYKRRMEREAGARDRWVRTVLRSVGDGVIAVDEDRRVRFMNPVAELLSGWTFEEVDGRPFADAFRFVDAGGNALAVDPVSAALAVGDRRSFPAGTLLRGAYGNTVAVEGNTTPLDDPESESRGAVIVFRDVTARLQAEETFRKLSQVVEQTADLVMVTDKYGRIEYVNPAFEAFTGYSMQDALGDRPSLSKSGQHGDAFYKRLWDTILAGKTFRDVLTNRKRDGSIYFEEKTISPLRDDAGRITHFVSTGRDATARILSERAAAEGRERLDQIARSLQAVLFSLDLRTLKVTYASGNDYVFGAPAEAIVADPSPFVARIHPQDLVRIREAIRGVAFAGRPFSSAFRYARDGDERWLRVMATPTEVSGAPILNGIVMDVTERVLADQDAARTRQRLEEITNSLQAVLFSFDLEQRRMTQVFGSETVFGRPPQVAFVDVDAFILGIPEAEREQARAAVLAGVEAGVPFQFEFRQDREGALRWIRAYCNPLRVDGRASLHGILFDVTEQKALETRAEVSGKLAVLGLLSAGIAHELNNPLGSISARVQRLKLTPTPELWADSTTFFEKQLQRMSGVIRRISTFSRLQSGRTEPCNVSKLITETLELVRLDPRAKGVSFAIDVPAGLAPIAADPGHIVHALINLVTNALDAVRGAGTVTVHAHDENGRCRICVTDDGPGIDPAILDRIFSPFVSSKDPAKGMGLGLYLSRTFVEASGGRLDLEASAPGRTTFYLEFPYFNEERHAASRPAH